MTSETDQPEAIERLAQRALRNPFLSDDGDMVLRQSVCVFMDILGYQEITAEAMETDNEVSTYQSLYNALNDSINQLHSGLPIGGKDLFYVRSFTDNIVIGSPIYSDDGESDIGHMLDLVQTYQLNMTKSGFFIRGGIAVGHLYMDEAVIFGRALVDAYQAESKLARDPRVVLHESSHELVNRHFEYYPTKSYAPQNRDLLRDADEMFFVNYLEQIMIAHPDGPIFVELLEEHKNQIQENLEKSKSRPTIWQKYFWCANYHNVFCDLYAGVIGSEYKIDLTAYTIRPTIIFEP